jgi:O-antigen/teichoic acid export membrane protein
MRSRAETMRGSAFVRGSALVLAGTLLWHASNFAFNAVSARMLGATQYGTLAAVIALLYVASPIFLSIQTVSSRITTRLIVRGEGDSVRELVRRYRLRLGLVGLAVAAAIALGSSALARFLRAPSGAPIAILGGAFLFSFVTHLQRGVLQGSMKFARYALSVFTEATVKITVTVVLLLWLWKSVDAAVMAIGVGAFVGMICNSALLGFLPRSDRKIELERHPYRYSIFTLSCLVLLALLLSVDLLAAKRYLAPHEAGLYAAVSLSGKIVFFATSALTLYLFPIFSERQERGLDSRGTLGGALLALVAASSVLVTVYFVAPQIVITPLFGSGYEAAGPYIGWIGIAFGAYAALYLTAMYLLVQESSLVTSVLTLAVLVQLTGLYFFHGSISQIIAVQGMVFGATALVLGSLCTHSQFVVSGATEPT